MPPDATHEQAPSTGAPQTTDLAGAEFDPGVLCATVSIGIVLAVLVGFVNARVNPPTYRPALPPTREPPPLAPGQVVVPTPAEVRPTYPPTVPIGMVARLRQALGKSREVLQERFDRLFGRPVDESTFESLEEALLTADVGMPTTDRIVGRVRQHAATGDTDPESLREVLREEMRSILTALDPALHEPATKPWVILVVGVNGSGKTTTIGKLAARFSREGKRVMLAAGDTFRAAATDQLEIWAERSGADIVSMSEGADPGAVVFDALGAALSRGHDVVIIDTAGRLQTRKPLMEQLGKIRRVIQKQVPDAPHETLLVLDGTMGQNGLSQAQLFHEATPLTGVVVTKLDGTAKGGMVLTIASEMELPVKLIGIGEGVEDLREFDPDAFVEALA